MELYGAPFPVTRYNSKIGVLYDCSLRTPLPDVRNNFLDLSIGCRSGSAACRGGSSRGGRSSSMSAREATKAMAPSKGKWGRIFVISNLVFR